MEERKCEKALSIGIMLIISSIIWGSVIIGTSYALIETGCYDKIQNYLVLGVISHITFLGAYAGYRIIKQGKASITK